MGSSMADQNESYSGDRKSLIYLTKNFVDIMKSSENGLLNLAYAGDILNVQKRRLYDITNVLEGIGLIHKTSKNTVQWRGQPQNVLGKESLLNLELKRLTEKEQYLDNLCAWAKANIRLAMQEKDSRALAYVTRDNLISCFNNHSVLVVKGHNRVERRPILVDDTIIFDRGLKVSSKAKPIEVLMATDEGQSLIATSASDDWKGESAGGGGASGGGKRKSKLVPTLTNNVFVNPLAIPDHFEVDRTDAADKKALQQRYQEYKKTANLLLNYRTKNPIQERRLRLRNYYQAKTPFVKLSENMSTQYAYSLYEEEGICDLFDIPPATDTSCSERLDETVQPEDSPHT